PRGKTEFGTNAFAAGPDQAAPQPWNVPRKSARNSRHGLPGEGPYLAGFEHDMRSHSIDRLGVCLADKEVGPNPIIDDQAGFPGLETRIQMNFRTAAHDAVRGI